MDIDGNDGDDSQTLDMLEAEQTFSDCEENGIQTQKFTSKRNTGVFGNVIPPRSVQDANENQMDQRLFQ